MKKSRCLEEALEIRGEVYEALEELEFRVKRKYGLNTRTARKLLRSVSRDVYSKNKSPFPYYI